MRWIGDRESENVEDRRGVGGGLPVGIGGIGAIVVVLVGLSSVLIRALCWHC